MSSIGASVGWPSLLSMTGSGKGSSYLVRLVRQVLCYSDIVFDCHFSLFLSRYCNAKDFVAMFHLLINPAKHGSLKIGISQS